MARKNIMGIKEGKLAEICGWYGMISLITAYALAGFGIIQADGIIYLLLNLTGGIGLLIIAAAKNVLQSVLLNLFWAIIGLIAIMRLILS